MHRRSFLTAASDDRAVIAKIGDGQSVAAPTRHDARACGLAVLLTALLAGCGQGPAAPPPRPQPVMTVAQPVTKQIVEWDAYTGRMEATEFVEVRPRVGGFLQSIHFDEGQMVTAGDLLCVIDPRPYEAELDSAEAALSQATSQVEEAKAKLQEAKAQQQQSDAALKLADARARRARMLKEQNALSEEELDQREADFLQATADVASSEARMKSAEAAITTATAAVESAKAAVETARLNLNYTRVHAPIDGRISREFVTEGNLVSGGTSTSTLLTTIASVEPIYCTFDVNEQDVLKYIRLALSGVRRSSREAKNPVFLGLVDESGFPRRGHMDFVDNRFDPSTASMRARCVFPNTDHVLLPGMFARIRIPGSAAYDAVLIPDSAIGTDQSAQFVYVVVDGAIERRVVESGPIVDGLRVIRSGLTGDESLVIEGLLQARPGLEVQTKPGTIEVVEDGLPDEYEPLPPDQWISPEPTPVPAAQSTARGRANDQTPPGETQQSADPVLPEDQDQGQASNLEQGGAAA